MTDLGKTEFKTPVLMNFATVSYSSKEKKKQQQPTVLHKEPGTLQYSSLKGSPNKNNKCLGWRREEIPLGRDGKPETSLVVSFKFSKALVSYS